MLTEGFYKASKKISRKIFTGTHTYSKGDLEGFKKSQKLAYTCALTIAKELKEGWSEKQTAKLMDVYLQDCGVRTFFHKSFAWFGDRSRFQGFKSYWDFLPSNRTLEATDVIILDTAPIYESYTSDIGYTYSLEPHPGLKRAQKKLLEFRQKIPTLFQSELLTKRIWEKVDADLKAAGYDNCHSQYPFSVLGHRVHKLRFGHLPGVTAPFSLHSYFSFIKRGIFPELLGPDHEGSKNGLWAIEPHLGGEGFGAKFEEILVVQSGQAYWLDNEVNPFVYKKCGHYRSSLWNRQSSF